MNKLVGEQFLGHDGPLNFKDIENAKVVGIYFSAHWCPPCRDFTPKLAAAFTDAINKKLPVQIIFASLDSNEKTFKEYFATMPWIALPYQDHKIEELKSKFGVPGIPMLVIVDKNGKLITIEGRAGINNSGSKAFEDWIDEYEAMNQEIT